MKGITYKNTKTTLPRWINNLHVEHSRGYAYETENHFVHLYGRESGFNVISVGLTAIEKKVGALEDWVIRTFGAEDIQKLKHEIGHTVEGVWRPSLYFDVDTYQALKCSQEERKLAEQSLRMLIDKLDELFIYIEPTSDCLNTYSHKTRELLILACTEVENSWKSYMTMASTKPINGKTFTTKDYVKLSKELYLGEYQFRLRSYSSVPPIRPFTAWKNTAPTISLHWYDAYNKTKHDRATYFSSATLNNCLSAVVANLVMHSVRFSPIPMFEETNTFSSLIKQHFDAELVDFDNTTYYIPEFVFPDNTRNDLFVFDPRESGYAKTYYTTSLIL